jgi:hypothetical protein
MIEYRVVFYDDNHPSDKPDTKIRAEDSVQAKKLVIMLIQMKAPTVPDLFTEFKIFNTN